jgi:hypothetical protein
MININVLSESSCQNFTQLEEGVQKHLEFGKKCQVFFNSYRKLKLTDEGCLSSADCYNNRESFSKMYRQISGHYVEKCKGDYKQLENEAMLLGSMDTLAMEEVNKNEEYTLRLIEIKKNIDLCKNIDDVFCNGVIELFRKASEVLIYKDVLFFLPLDGGYTGSIGECHCDNVAMGRSSRRKFSEFLCREISDIFAKTQPLTIASIGAGLCFHELEIHTLVTASGYKVKDWEIVDPIIVTETIKNFQTILQWQDPQVEVVTKEQRCQEYFTQIAEGSHLNGPPHVFLFIDVDQHIFSSTIAKMTTLMRHDCLFAEFQKRSGEEAWERMNFIQVNKNT